MCHLTPIKPPQKTGNIPTANSLCAVAHSYSDHLPRGATGQCKVPPEPQYLNAPAGALLRDSVRGEFLHTAECESELHGEETLNDTMQSDSHL